MDYLYAVTFCRSHTAKNRFQQFYLIKITAETATSALEQKLQDY